jgi:hypothetical protein
MKTKKERRVGISKLSPLSENKSKHTSKQNILASLVAESLKLAIHEHVVITISSTCRLTSSVSVAPIGHDHSPPTCHAKPGKNRSLARDWSQGRCSSTGSPESARGKWGQNVRANAIQTGIAMQSSAPTTRTRGAAAHRTWQAPADWRKS